MQAFDEGIVTRGDVFITTKIYGGNYERAGGIIDDALKDLNVDYIDKKARAGNRKMIHFTCPGFFAFVSPVTGRKKRFAETRSSHEV